MNAVRAYDSRSYDSRSYDSKDSWIHQAWKISQTLLMSCSVLVLGCSIAQLKPGADKVRVFHNSTAAIDQKNCKHLGLVIASQGPAFGPSMSNTENMLRGALNELRNQAIDLGANVVVIQDTTQDHSATTHVHHHRTHAFDSRGRLHVLSRPTMLTSNESVSGVTHTGDAYRCTKLDDGATASSKP